MTIAAFLRARLDEDAATVRSPRSAREIEAIRRILEWHEGPHSCSGDDDNCLWTDGDDGSVYCDTVKVIAGVYADHPDYRADWDRRRISAQAPASAGLTPGVTILADLVPSDARP